MAQARTSIHISQTEANHEPKSSSKNPSVNTPQGAFHVVLFDLDGTLLDTTQAIYESLRYTIRHFTGRTPKDEELHPYMGLPVYDQFSSLLPGQAAQACDVYETHNLEIHKDYVKPYPGAVDVLHTLKATGVRIALVTSKRQKTATVGIGIAGIRHLFDAAVFCEDTSENKPHPAPVLKALELLGYTQDLACLNQASPLKALMVGDSPWDIASAKNALRFLEDKAEASGWSCPRPAVPVIKTAGVTYGTFPKEAVEAQNPDYILDSISQVLTLCGLEA